MKSPLTRGILPPVEADYFDAVGDREERKVNAPRELLGTLARGPLEPRTQLLVGLTGEAEAHVAVAGPSP
jgi:hypothetical protein